MSLHLPDAEDVAAARVGKPLEKPEPRTRTKGRKDRKEATVKQQVRAIVAERDGDCRLLGLGFGACGGESEWAHLEDRRRARTRGMPPEMRHTTEDTAMFCTLHHQRYDKGEMRIDFLDPQQRANDRLRYWFGPLQVYTEPMK